MKEYYVEPEFAHVNDTGIEFFYQSSGSDALIVSPHIHTSVEMLFIKEGSFRVTTDNVEYIIHPGDTILFRSNTIHTVFMLDGKNPGYYVLKVRPGNVLDFSSKSRGASYLLRLALTGKNEKSVWRGDEETSVEIRNALEDIIRETADGHYATDIALKLYSAKILMLMLRDMEKVHSDTSASRDADQNLVRRIYDTIVYINSNYASEITAQECAARQYMSYSYFSRSFKRITGTSFKDYLNMTRINHAEKALMSGNKTITEIATMCGFNNVSYFISVYKSRKGTTPSCFRELVNHTDSDT